MCKSFQFVICTSICKLDPPLTNIKNIWQMQFNFIPKCSLYMSTSVTIRKYFIEIQNKAVA